MEQRRVLSDNHDDQPAIEASALSPLGTDATCNPDRHIAATTTVLHNTSSAALNTCNDNNITRKTRPANKDIPELTKHEAARFWSQVRVGKDSECWPWTGAVTTQAVYSKHILYGQWNHFKTHRVAYSYFNGPIPDGLTIDHVKARGCKDTLCCNPAHLEPISMTEQVARRDAGKPPECTWGHPRIRGRKCDGCSRLNRWRHILKYPEKYPEGQRVNAPRELYKLTNGKEGHL